MTPRTPVVPPEMVQPVFHSPIVRPYSDDFAVQLSVYGKLLPSQPASVYHGGLWLYLLHLLHRPEPRYACRDYRPSRLHLPRRALTLPSPPAPPSRAPVRLPRLPTG